MRRGAPLPEGTEVEIRVSGTSPEIPPDLQEELDAWQRARTKALNLADRLVEEGLGLRPGR